MHGVRRETRSAEQIASDQEKFAKCHAALAAALDRRNQRLHDVESMKASAAALATNVELYSMWNFRREIVEHFVQCKPDQAPLVLQEELRLTERAIAENPKSYWVWHHRKWCGERFHSLMDWARELKLCEKLLMLDARNFHCWTYRRWVLSRAGAAPAVELAFTEAKITANLSNYSAWHSRSAALGDTVARDASVAEAELRLAEQAVMVEPRDSAPWLYIRWLAEASPALLPAALRVIDELLAIEPQCKGALLCAAHLLTMQNRHHDAILMVERAAAIDPQRAGHYRDWLARLRAAEAAAAAAGSEASA